MIPLVYHDLTCTNPQGRGVECHTTETTIESTETKRVIVTWSQQSPAKLVIHIMPTTIDHFICQMYNLSAHVWRWRQPHHAPSPALLPGGSPFTVGIHIRLKVYPTVWLQLRV